MTKERKLLILTGILFGALAVVLMLSGNPGNMGFCLSCFLRDIAGSLRLHSVSGVSYMRPEVLGLIIGAFVFSLVRGEFRAVGGSSPALRFLLGFSMMVGSLVFLGCPVRALLRLGAGDLNALVGIIGLIAGIAAGSFFLNSGFTLGRAYETTRVSGLVFPATAIVFLSIAIFFPQFLNGGAPHAPIWMSLTVSIVLGALCMRTRLCTIGSFRDVILMRDTTLLSGSAGILIGALLFNLLLGSFRPGFQSQPIAHSEHLWNLLGLFLVGLSATLAGGCPLRQIILSSGGNTDSAITVIGMVTGAAFCHNYGYAASAKGVPVNGKIMCSLLIALVLAIAAVITITNRRKMNE